MRENILELLEKIREEIEKEHIDVKEIDYLLRCIVEII